MSHKTYYCYQCLNSNLNIDCPLYFCEKRFKETGKYEKDQHKMQTYFGKDRQYWTYLICIKDKLSLIDATCKFENIVIWNCTKLLEYEKEPNKMTREEAVKKVEFAHAVRGSVFKEQVEKIVDAIEALGLIKFDELAKEPSPIEKGLTQAIGTVGYVKLTNWCINHGYQILKKSVGSQKETSPSLYSIVSKNSNSPNQILAELEYWGYKIVKKY